MEPRSSLTFKSNIYPTSGHYALTSDRRFLSSISDPEALDILWHYKGTNGKLLNGLQERQQASFRQCEHAEKGDLPWGTPVDGGHVVCLCEKSSCPLHSGCVKSYVDGVWGGDNLTTKMSGELTVLGEMPWTIDEDAIVAVHFSAFGNGVSLSQLKRHERREIERRAELLGVTKDALIRDGGKSVLENMAANLPSRGQWENELIDSYYDTYGPSWSLWEALIPWMHNVWLRKRAERLGHEIWTQEDRKRFLKDEGLSWSYDELEYFIENYPIRLEDAYYWRVNLPMRSKEERLQLAKLLGLPNVDEIREMRRKARAIKVITTALVR